MNRIKPETIGILIAVLVIAACLIWHAADHIAASEYVITHSTIETEG